MEPLWFGLSPCCTLAGPALKTARHLVAAARRWPVATCSTSHRRWWLRWRPRCYAASKREFTEWTTGIDSTWWLIPLSKWVITPVINGISRVNPLIIGVITHLLSGMRHQVYAIYIHYITSHRIALRYIHVCVCVCIVVYYCYLFI